MFQAELQAIGQNQVLLSSLCLGWQDTDGLGITLATKLTDVINETMTDPMVGILHHEEVFITGVGVGLRGRKKKNKQ